MSERVQELFDTKIRKVVLAYERGTPIKDIAGRVGVSAPTVAKWLTQEGYKHKRRGRPPLAMRARARDLRQRGWPPRRISGLLDITIQQAEQWGSPQQNPPILGSGPDPLAVRGERGRKKEKTKGRKKKGAKARKKEKETPGWPPPRHKCRKHWNDTEKAYVLQLMEAGVSVREIYKRMRASKKRQMRIWREAGRGGLPPNFPPPTDWVPPTGEPPVAPPEVQARREEIKALEEEGSKRLIALEEAAAERQKRIAELEAEALEDEKRIKALEDQRKALVAEHRKRAEQLKVTERVLAEPGVAIEPTRVLPGSFEAEELRLPVGQRLAPKGKPGPKPKPKVEIREYADNGRYFVVSKDWADLSDAAPDELKLYAAILTRNKFPARVERHGNMPKSYVDDTMPAPIRAKFERTLDKANEILEKYRLRKKELDKKKEPSIRVLRYLLYAYDGYRNPKLSADQKFDAKQKLQAQWRAILKQKDKIDAFIMIFKLGYAEPNGAPTDKAIQKGFRARAILQRRKRREETAEDRRETRLLQRAIKEQDLETGASMLASFKKGESVVPIIETPPEEPPPPEAKARIIETRGAKARREALEKREAKRLKEAAEREARKKAIEKKLAKKGKKVKKKTKKKASKKVAKKTPKKRRTPTPESGEVKVTIIKPPKEGEAAAELDALFGAIEVGATKEEDEAAGAAMLRGFRPELPEGEGED